VHTTRFVHVIHGREYTIEVLAVARDRWRAQIVRAPGGATALMPFYGATPEAAAERLAGWLGRAAMPPAPAR
jgi:hypothetical protein